MVPITSPVIKAVNSGRVTVPSLRIESSKSAVSVLLAAGGYPESAQTGSVILNIPNVKETITFHAGTSRSTAGLVSSGGRVLSVTGIGEDLTEARDRAYRAISQITLPGSFYRTDIALNASVAEKGN